jgi:hypothetical protein
MEQGNITHNRQSRRSNVLLAATIEVAGASVPVKLRNLSTEGALIEGDDLPIEGSEVLFRRNELRVSSRVAWVDGKHAGIAFRRQIPQEDVLRNIPSPRHRAQPKYGRSGLAHRKLTPQELSLAQSWAWTPWSPQSGS